MIRRPPGSTRTDTLFPYRRSSDLKRGRPLRRHRPALRRPRASAWQQIPAGKATRDFSIIVRSASLAISTVICSSPTSQNSTLGSRSSARAFTSRTSKTQRSIPSALPAMAPPASPPRSLPRAPFLSPTRPYQDPHTWAPLFPCPPPPPTRPPPPPAPLFPPPLTPS